MAKTTFTLLVINSPWLQGPSHSSFTAPFVTPPPFVHCFWYIRYVASTSVHLPKVYLQCPLKHSSSKAWISSGASLTVYVQLGTISNTRQMIWTYWPWFHHLQKGMVTVCALPILTQFNSDISRRPRIMHGELGDPKNANLPGRVC